MMSAQPGAEQRSPLRHTVMSIFGEIPVKNQKGEGGCLDSRADFTGFDLSGKTLRSLRLHGPHPFSMLSIYSIPDSRVCLANV